MLRRAAALALVALAVSASASAHVDATAATHAKAPTGLHGFLLRADESLTHTFPRTPAFAWNPVPGALCYEFELSSSRGFGENSIIWSNVKYGVGGKPSCSATPVQGSATASGTSSSTGSDTKSGATPSTTGPSTAGPTSIAPIRMPAVSTNVALPWFTGEPYAIYTHVRAITRGGATHWSTPFAFNMRWPSVPEPLAGQPGLVRWTEVEGATGYQVWYSVPSHAYAKVFSTHTNVADERELYAFHDPSWYTTVKWRVRAVRNVYGDIPNGLPAVSYGPWSPTYTATNPALSTGPLTLRNAISDATSDAKKQSAHALMPAMTFAGDDSSVVGYSTGLFRAYAFTDRDCVNVVYRGAIVASPAYAPRTTGALKLPGSAADITAAQTKLLGDGAEGTTKMADGTPVVSSETAASASSGTGTGGTSSGGTGSSGSATVAAAKVDLPDTDFPSTRYFWTVVPVGVVVDDSGTGAAGFVYTDAELPQDVCAAGRIQSFGKESAAVPSVSGAPFVTGLSPSGRLTAARSNRPAVYGAPLVAWLPAAGADAYEIQWSHSKYPWKASGSIQTYATSATLPLRPGTWYYRVRGLNSTQMRRPQMSWSTPVTVSVAKPRFAVVSH